MSASGDKAGEQVIRVGYAEVGQGTAAAANRWWWDAEADDYQAEHGAFLSGGQQDDLGKSPADFIWCPEGLREADAELLGPTAALDGQRVLEVGCGAAQCARWLVR